MFPLLARLSFFCAASLALAQTADQQNEGSGLARDPTTGAWDFSWWGVEARTYFILHSETLMSWTFLPVIEQGREAPISYGFWLNPQPDRLFLRLRYTDIPTDDPYSADFDGDGIPNGWEIEHGLDPFDASDAALLQDGLTHLELYQQAQGIGADPETANVAGLLVYTPQP